MCYRRLTFISSPRRGSPLETRSLIRYLCISMKSRTRVRRWTYWRLGLKGRNRLPCSCWEPTGGPLVAQQKQIVAHDGRLLLVGTAGPLWRSPDSGKTWEAAEERMPRPWVIAANRRTLFGDAIDGVLRSSD